MTKALAWYQWRTTVLTTFFWNDPFPICLSLVILWQWYFEGLCSVLPFFLSTAWAARGTECMKPHRPPMTNVGTETAFRHDHLQAFPKRLTSIEVGGQLIWSNMHRSTCLGSRISTQKEPFPWVKIHTGLQSWCWPIAKCRFSTKGSVDHDGKNKKEMVKKWFRKNKKKLEHSRRSVRKLMETLATTQATQVQAVS